jgi:AbrB family looped-hinge helix DNA binding protein
MVEDVKVAYVFPGQESIKVGMGLDFYVHYTSARQVFEEVDKALGFPLSRFWFEGPEEDLAQTMNAQAAIMTVGIACLKAGEEMSGALQVSRTAVWKHIRFLRELGCRIEAVLSVDERGQMVLPKDVREKAGIKTGEKLALISWSRGEDVCCLALMKAENLNGIVKNILGPLMQEPERD